jgi:ubiquinone/menaquinone biosynthesis C-methylase UbiE
MKNQRNDFTYRLLVDGGVKKGMRVLDVGCGSGDVSMMVAELVGKSGEVIGFDVSESAVVTAQGVAQQNQLTNIKFVIADITELPHDLGQFDAIVGRRVLMYQKDAVNSVKSLLPFLKPDGVLIFQESDCMGTAMNTTSMSLHNQVQSWIWNTVAKENGNIHIGSELYSIMKQAGLNIGQIGAEAILQTHESGSDLAWVTKMMLKRITKFGVATEEEIDIDTLDGRLQNERKQSNNLFIRDMAFGVWAKL